MVSVKSDGHKGAQTFLVGPVEIVFVEVEVCPVVAKCYLQGVDALKDTVACRPGDRLHRYSVVTDAKAISVVCADIFVTYGVSAGVVGVGIGK